jgi:NADP-dependent 3-hydroxy acid dehydrogenase YdfG
MDLQLYNKTAFISGSTAGIGLAIAEALLKENATVIINGRKQTQVEEVVKALQHTFPKGKVSGLAADFGKKKKWMP